MSVTVPAALDQGAVHRDGHFLSSEAVRGILAALADGEESQSAIAARFGISQRTVSSINVGRSHAEVGGPSRPIRHSTRTGWSRRRTLAPEQVREIRAALAAGVETQREIAARFDTHQVTVSLINTGQAYRGTS